MSQGNIVETGEKLHVITRRNFPEDLRRHFVGTVRAASGAVVRTEGYVFVFNPNANEYRRRSEQRTRIFDLGDASLIVNVLPPDLVIADLVYTRHDGRLVVTDGRAFSLDINEFGWND